MKRVSPSRIRWYSSAIGSLTLSTMSASPHTSSAESIIVRAGGDVLLVGDLRAEAGVLLDDHLVAVLGELVDADRRDGHPVLVVLDFLGDADLHLRSSLTGAGGAGVRSV